MTSKQGLSPLTWPRFRPLPTFLGTFSESLSNRPHNEEAIASVSQTRPDQPGLVFEAKYNVSKKASSGGPVHVSEPKY